MRTIPTVLLCTAALFAWGENSGRRAPGFALPDSRMQVYDLADYRGKIVLLELMQTTCGHCAAFADVIGRVQQKYGDKVAILAVVNSRSDDQNTVAKYIAGHRVTYPILFDAGQMAYSYVRSASFDTPHVFGRQVAPADTAVENPAFDVTPARYVGAIITERGVARAPYEESLRKLAS